MSTSEKKSGNNYSGVFAVCMLSALFILIGALLQFVPGMKMVYFSYMIAVILAVIGIWLIASYFSRKAYRKVANYDFSVGVFLVLAAVLVVIRAADIASHGSVLLGIMCLIEGIIILQNAIQIKILRGGIWVGILACSILILAASMLIVTNPKKIITSHMSFLYFLLIVIGILGFVSMLTVWFHTVRFRKVTVVQDTRNLEEAENLPEDASDYGKEQETNNIFEQEDLTIESENDSENVRTDQVSSDSENTDNT